MANIGVIVADLLIESVPLALFFLSVILFGNILRHIYISKNLEDLCNKPIKFDLFSLTMGLLVTFIPIFYNKGGVLDIASLNEQKIWIGIIVTTFVFGTIIWNYRMYGKKWIKDSAQIIIAMIFAGFLIYMGYNAIVEGFRFFDYKQCLGVTSCLVKFFIEKIFKIGLAILFLIWGFKLFVFIKKERRYPIKKR